MGQTPRSRSQGKIMVLSQGIFMWNIKALALTVRLLSVMKSSSFLVAFITVKNVLEIIKPLTVKL